MLKDIEDEASKTGQKKRGKGQVYFQNHTTKLPVKKVVLP